MASANLELVRSIYGEWERNDFSSSGWMDPEIEWVSADGPSAGVYKGKAALAGGFRDWLSTWQDWRVEAEEYRDLDEDRVLVLFHFSARGKASGLEVGQIWTKGASLFHVRDGKVVRLVQYLERDRALEELGLA